MNWRELLNDVAAELRREDERAELAQARHLEHEAKRFLRDLDPDSQEGMWFEAFAECYPSRLEAALVYVRDR
ncbi:MAG TPA: hypothetical protein VM580_03535 [Labilithrix sp.]|nr:hypothetical protein [Labilithrix sp.]